MARKIRSHWRRLRSEGVPPPKKIVRGLQVGGHPFQLADERAHVAIDQLTAGRLGIEGAIEALAHAEGHVDIETGNRLGSGLGHSRK